MAVKRFNEHVCRYALCRVSCIITPAHASCPRIFFGALYNAQVDC